MVKQKTYIPKQGDLIWLNFDPQSGREQKGRRPALVVSSHVYNKTGMAFVCPITSKKKGYSFEVPFETKNINGVILADHLKQQDLISRKAKHIGNVSPDALEMVLTLIAAILDEQHG